MKQVYIDKGTDETRIAVVENGLLADLLIQPTGAENETRVGQIILGRIKTILPNRFTFIDMGTKKNAFTNLEAGHGLKAGDAAVFLVQKDASGNKGMYVSPQLSIRSRLAVLTEDPAREVGVSRKITNEQTHRRLKKLARALAPAAHGLILRTAAKDATPEEITEDVKNLCDKLAAIRARAAHAMPPLVLHVPSALDELLENADEIYQSETLLPGGTSLFDLHGITPQIKKALAREVILLGGGYITIEETEACVVIDVNSGSSVTSTSAEINARAAAAIALHLRLRNLSGIIIIDFISMDSKTERESLLNILREALLPDPAKPELHGITSLGLVQMIRPRTRPPLSHFMK